MNMWNNSPIVALSCIDDNTVVFATGNNLCFYCLLNENIQTVSNLSPTQSVLGIIHRQNVVKFNCADDREALACFGLNAKFIIVFGNRLCKILTLSDNCNIKNLRDFPTDDYIRGVSLFRKTCEFLLLTVSINGLVNVYSFSDPEFKSFHLLTTFNITNYSMLYCMAFADFIDAYGKSLLFIGSTSNRIHVWSFNDETHSQMTPLSNFGVQKGIIFSVDVYQPSHAKSCLIASAAEDRSVVIWSSNPDSNYSMHASACRKWTILYRLDACCSNDLTSSLIFGARIWCVRINDWGIVTAGEDCSIVFYPWPNSPTDKLKQVLLKSVHRGRSIWCLDTHITNTTEMKIVSGGNDGGLIVNEVNFNSIDDSSSLNPVGNLKPKINIPKTALSSSLVKHEFPSDVIFLTSQLIADLCVKFPSMGSETVILSSSLRNVFISREGKVFTILESGDLTLLRSVDGSTSELTVIQPVVSSGLFKRLKKDAQYIQDDGIHLRQNGLFPGYCVSGVHRESGRFALGGRWGCLGIYEIEPSEDEVLCWDLINLPPFQRITHLQWISERELVAGIYPHLTVYIYLKDSVSDDHDGVFQSLVYLQRSSGNTEWKDLTWTTCADACNIDGVTNRRCVVTGTRSGGINLHALPTLDSNLGFVKPSWYFDQCHGREGITAIKIIKNSIVITAGRQHGRVHRWRIVSGDGDGSDISLQPLDQILKPSNISWIGAFSNLPSGEILALGFISTKLLAADIVPPNGENLISEGGSTRFTIDCAGGHRSWDFAHNPLDDSLTFAAILKDSLLFTSQPVKRIQSDCGFRRKCLIPSLHGRDINTCLLIPRKEYTANQDGLIINCYTGSEDFYLGSFALEVRSDNTSNGPAVSYYKSSTPTFHSGHISNIRCLTSVNSYLITGGGRGMLAVWRLDPDRTHQPGLVGWILINTGVRESGPLHSCSLDKKCRNSYSMCDLRVMALLAYQMEEHCISVIAGCSDGSIRLLKVNLPTEATGWQPRFFQLCDLRSGLKRKCVLSLCELSSVVEGCVSIGYTNTGGTVSGLELDLRNGVLLNTTFTIQLEVENPVTKSLISCAANSITVVKNRIVVAGDDGSIRLADFQGRWIAKVTKHFAAVVKVISPDCQSHLLSLGADHRLLMWNLTEKDEFSVVSELTLTGLGDPQNVSVIACQKTPMEFLAMVCGSGVQLCRFRL